MKKELNLFFKNIKTYIDYLMTLGFQKLGVHFISLVFMVFIGLLLYIPIGLLADLVIQGIGIVPNVPVIVITIIDYVFAIISFIAFLATFIYMFNRRFEEKYIKEINGEVEETEVSEEPKVLEKEDKKVEEVKEEVTDSKEEKELEEVDEMVKVVQPEDEMELPEEEE